MSDFLSEYGRYTELERSGVRWRGRCPMHKDDTPSFVVYPDGGWFCYGACATGGSLEWFLHLMGEKTVKTDNAPHLPVRTDKVDEIPFSASYSHIVAWGHALDNHAPALSYLESRGIGMVMRDDAWLGWIGENDERIPLKARRSFANKIIIPFLTAQDEPQGAKLRSIDEKEFRAWGSVSEPYGMWNALNFGRSARKVTFFVEGELDALLLRSLFEDDWTYRAVASPAKHITQRHVDNLLGVAGRRILLADNDAAGEAHAQAMQALIPALEVHWSPLGKDIGDMYRLDSVAGWQWLAGIVYHEHA